MAVCVYTKLYGDVARGVIGRTLARAVFSGFSSPKTRHVFNKGKRTLEEMEGFGNHLQMDERNIFWRAAVNYLGKKIETYDAYDRFGYRI